MTGEASLETSPKANMIQDMINADNMNLTESTIPNIFKTLKEIIKSPLRPSTICIKY